MIQCGEDFTLAGTSTNSVYFWGTRRKNVSSRTTSAAIGGYAEIRNNRLETIPSVERLLDTQGDGATEGVWYLLLI